MCGPSKAMKNLNATVQSFTKQVTAEAGTIFGDSNTVFNNIMDATQNIVHGGPSQAGFSQNELNARNAANVEAAGAMARNLKGAAASSAGAIGGGNVVAPAGSTQAAVQNAEIAAAKTQAAGENAITDENYAVGRDNFFKSLSAEQQAPGVFSTSISANSEAGNQLTAAQKSQQDLDNSSNWWKNDLMKLGMTAAGAATSAFTGGLGAGWAKSITGGGKVGSSFFGGADTGQISQSYEGPSFAPTTTSDVGNQIG
jgi:hypothetical protein